MLRFVGGWGGGGCVGVVASGVKSTSKFVPNVSKFVFDQREKKNSCWARLINQLAKSVMNIMFSFFTEVPHFHIFVIQVNLIILGLFLTVCCHAFTF